MGNGRMWGKQLFRRPYWHWGLYMYMMLWKGTTNHQFVCIWNLQVLPLSDLNDTVCRCDGDTFSSSFSVPQNVINFLLVWNKFTIDNASVYGMLIAVFVIYLVLVIFLQRQDRKNNQVLFQLIQRHCIVFTTKLLWNKKNYNEFPGIYNIIP